MGINRETASFLCEARARGASFESVLTLGRQNLHLDAGALRALAREQGLPGDAATEVLHDYSERFFRRFLGSARVDSIDHSGYEGAALTHDLNEPVPAAWEQRYDAVVDGGTLEHVFNFPTALANCMRMVRTGGRLFIFTPANNQLGHGFYQFSPELFFRTLSRAHGFEVEKMLAVQFRFSSTECGSIGRPYEVADPAQVGSRITLVNSRPVTLMIQARKVEHRSAPFATFPQQSDYDHVWATGDGNSRPPARAVGETSLLRRAARLVKAMLPARAVERLRNEYDRRFVHSLRNRAFYRPDGARDAASAAGDALPRFLPPDRGRLPEGPLERVRERAR